MLNEKYLNNKRGSETVTMKTSDAEKNPRGFVGEVFDYEINPITGEKTQIGHGFNLVVDTCSKLIAALIKGDVKGVQYLAVGRGSDSWGNEVYPDPTLDETHLIDEIYRKEIQPEDIVFIDDENNVSESITNRIQITVTFLESEANGELRELGFFGGNATSLKDSGLMLNHKNHGCITKTSGMQLQRIVRFTF